MHLLPPKQISTSIKLTELLKHHSAKYHTYTLKTERSYRVVIRGLHPSIDIDLIKQDLENLRHVPTNIVNIKKTVKRRDQNGKITNRDVKVYPLFYVDLMPKANNKMVYKITHLGGKAHDSTKCQLKDATKFICANCKESHSSNYHGCQGYRELEKELNKPNCIINIGKKNQLRHSRQAVLLLK